MELLEGIESRRSIGKVKQDPVEREKIETLLKLATKAPNHHLTEPWRFFVMTGAGRKVLGNAYTEIALEKVKDPSDEIRADIEESQQAKARRAPVVIAVTVSFSGDDEIQRIEDRAATHAAIQNIILGAHGMGLGAIWRTGAPLYHLKMKQAFGLGDNEEMVGFVYIGYPGADMAEKPRKPVSEVATWIS